MPSGRPRVPLIQKHVDHVVQVDEEAIAMSIFRLAEDTKAVVEGAGATGLAALWMANCPNFKQTRGGAPVRREHRSRMLGRVMDLGLVPTDACSIPPSSVTDPAVCRSPT